MAKKSRDKGAAFEREIAQRLSRTLGRNVRRRLGQARDAGHDLDGMEPWVIELKRRKTLGTVEGWLRQVAQAALTVPAEERGLTEPGADVMIAPHAVIARSDGGEPFVILPLDLFEELVRIQLGVRSWGSPEG